MLIGHTLKDRYEVYDRLGSGGAATVYLARDDETGRIVTVKMLHPHLLNEEFIARFEREIDLLQKVDNPHIVRLYDWAIREFNPDLGGTISYLVTEYVEGHALSDVIDTRAPLSETDALAIARQIALGLAAIHRLGIIHRDVKSQNIMITPENQAKLIDFGIAKGSDHATLTDPSHFAGTLYYAPPEQILESRTVDHRADIYALGVVLYEMLTGRLPVSAREFGTVASRIISGNLDPITGVSPPVEKLVNAMLAHRVERRIGSAEEVISRIDAITGGQRKVAIERPPTTGATIPRPIHVEKLPEPPVPPSPAYLLIEGHPEETILLTRPEVIVGRSHPRYPVSPDVDLWTLGVKDAQTVSRRHCRIFQREGAYFIEDLGSMNGTRVNDEPLHPGHVHRLEDGDRVAVGNVLMTFHLPGE
ncbi:MAG TPA: FHA domain-containing protein [Chloroflexi bacterium]|nr:FHA domain-containing protein [Chloroflexota bacterium]